MGNFFTDVISKDPRFTSTERIADIKLLEPATNSRVQAIISSAYTMGVPLMVFETFRSRERQQLLYQQGVTRLKEVGVHFYGLACDIVRSVNGEPSWKGDWAFLGELAQANGMIWGGNWGQPGVQHKFVDSVHVQRCTVNDQPSLFSSLWYPDASYNPYEGDEGVVA
jgi:D-alanyl-D-alanine carboxypeptidase